MGRLLTTLLALLILNSSIETSNVAPVYWDGEDYVEDLSFNDIESVLELVTESWLELDDLIPEQDDPDDDHTSFKVVKDWASFPLCLSPGFTILSAKYVLFESPSMKDEVSKELFSPPDGLRLI